MNSKFKIGLIILFCIASSVDFAQNYKIVSSSTNTLASFSEKYKVIQVVGQMINGSNSNDKYFQFVGIVNHATPTLTEIDGDNGELPTEYSIEQNFPNPFNPETKIKYNLPLTSFVQIKVYDLLGREVAQLANQEQNAGRYMLSFDAIKYGLSSGVYIYLFRAGEYVRTKKMILMK